MMRSYLYIFLTICLTIYGQIVIKWRVNQHVLANGQHNEPIAYVTALLFDPFVLTGLAAAFLASCTWMLALGRLELSKAYPFMAMSFVFVPIVAWAVLAEGVTLSTFVGAALIVAGIAISVA